MRTILLIIAAIGIVVVGCFIALMSFENVTAKLEAVFGKVKDLQAN